MEKTVEYHLSMIRKLSFKLNKARKAYTDIIERKIKFFGKYGYFNKDYESEEMSIYLRYCDLIMQLRNQEEIYQLLTGELCQEGNH